MEKIKFYFIKVLKENFANFSGRARREEYWYYSLAVFVISAILSVLSKAGIVGVIFSILSFLFSLCILIPGIAVSVRRLHDTGRSGWWLLLCLIPLIGQIVLLVFMVTEGQKGENKWGDDPKKEVNA
ncbi:MAG: DUF805 domain-containing protein [Bacteroidales bacterium]|nr:DUF805 domain-containing protein [Bacteroidales bacterium]